MPITPITAVTSLIIAPIAQTRPPGDTGAWAEEVAESRIGLESGLDGAKNVTQLFRVYTANASDNPIQTIKTLPPTRGGRSTMSRFPTTGGWGDGSYVLYNFAIVDHWIGTNVWILEARYVPSYVASIPTELWTFRMRSSLETEHVLADRNGKGIGLPSYQPWKSPPPAGGPDPPIIAAPRFTAKSLNPAYPEAILQLPDSSADPTAKHLPRHITGADRPKRTSVFTITKTLSSLQNNLTAINWAAENMSAVNSDTFSVRTTAGDITWVKIGASRGLQTLTPIGMGTVMFVDMDLEPIINEAGGSVPSYRITLTFKYDPGFRINLGGGRMQWMPPFQEVRPHMKEWDDGSKSPVMYGPDAGERANTPVWEHWDMIGATNLTGLVGGFR